MIVKNLKRDNFSVKSRKRNKVVPNRGKTTSVKSIIRTSSILRCLSKNIHSIKEIADHCRLSMATVHRILQTLEESELAFQDPINRKYYLGPLFTQLSLSQINAHQYLIVQSAEEVNRIWDLFGEFTALNAEVGMRIIQLVNIPSKFNYSISRIDDCPMFYGSHSKVLMAQHSDDEIEVILNSVTPKPPSNHCVTDREQLKEQFMEARRQGYYICRKEIDEIVMGISVPIKNYMCPASLSVVGPEIHLEAISAVVIKELLISANRISDRISGGM
jgi:DNA-binding IclR family transcriptional regulator